mgnify:CR=1 FL=1
MTTTMDKAAEILGGQATGEDTEIRMRCADCTRRAGEPIDAGEWEGPRSEPTCPHCGGGDLIIIYGRRQEVT